MRDRKEILAQRRKDYADLFGTTLGQKVLRDMMDRHSIFTQAFEPMDPCSSAFNEGQRCVVLGVLELVRFGRGITPDEFIQDRNDSIRESNPLDQIGT